MYVYKGGTGATGSSGMKGVRGPDGDTGATGATGVHVQLIRRRVARQATGFPGQVDTGGPPGHLAGPQPDCVPLGMVGLPGSFGQPCSTGYTGHTGHTGPRGCPGTECLII